MFTASFIHKEFFEINIAINYCSVHYCGICSTRCVEGTTYITRLLVDARAEEVGDNIASDPHLYITKLLYMS